jgi:hypothetical protein
MDPGYRTCHAPGWSCHSFSSSYLVRCHSYDCHIFLSTLSHTSYTHFLVKLYHKCGFNFPHQTFSASHSLPKVWHDKLRHQPTKALDNFPPPRILGFCIDVPGCWPGPSLRQLPKRPKIQPRYQAMTTARPPSRITHWANGRAKP